jgi:hypothetical protein
MIEQRRRNVMADRRIRMAQLEPMHAGQFINWRALGWSLVILTISAALLGLMAVGK